MNVHDQMISDLQVAACASGSHGGHALSVRQRDHAEGQLRQDRAEDHPRQEQHLRQIRRLPRAPIVRAGEQQRRDDVGDGAQVRHAGGDFAPPEAVELGLPRQERLDAVALALADAGGEDVRVCTAAARLGL